MKKKEETKQEQPLTIEQLKVKAYDLIAEFEQANAYVAQIKGKLDLVNQDIAKLQKETPKE